MYLGKQYRNSFQIDKSRRAKQPLELVYIDMCDKSTVKSSNHNKYIWTLINDFISKTWIYLLKEKSESFNKFKEFKNSCWKIK